MATRKRVRALKLLGLSRRQIEIAKLVEDGFSNKEIAEWVLITVRTVKYHMSEIFRKVKTRNRGQLMLFMLRGGSHES